MACGNIPKIASMFSLHALGLPGNVMIRLLLRIPETGLLKAANGVTVKDVARSIWVIPGVNRSMIEVIALNINH